MSRLPITSRDLAVLRVAEQRARPQPPRAVARARRRGLPQLLRSLWAWLEQPEAQAPASRPLATHFYTEL